MKITNVRTVLAERYLFVEIATDAGIKGVGESGAWAFVEASAGAVELFRRYLLGKDPRLIEHHWQYLYRWSHFRGAAIMGALSAIDIALWDILGKHLGVPCYQLLGGRCRERVRVYYHVFGQSTEDLVAQCVRAKDRGFTAVGHLNPFLDAPRTLRFTDTYARRMASAIGTVAAVRDAVGDEVDLCVELHRQLTPGEAIVFMQGIEDYHPLFCEDPVPPDNLDAMAEVSKRTRVPIATGERLHSIYEFEMLLNRALVQYVRPDVCLCGGLTHAKKIAAIAEAHYAEVVPHNPLSPVSTAACIQLAAAIPNFCIQEYPLEEATTGQAYLPPGAEQLRPESIVREPYEVDGGYVLVPDSPGLGVELVDNLEGAHPFRGREIETRLRFDGSVIDQ